LLCIKFTKNPIIHLGSEIHSIASTTMTLQDKANSIIESRSRTQSAVGKAINSFKCIASLETVVFDGSLCGEFKRLLWYLNPLDIGEFREGSLFDKVLMMIKVSFILRFNGKVLEFDLILVIIIFLKVYYKFIQISNINIFTG
jgi:hypothetical protein